MSKSERLVTIHDIADALHVNHETSLELTKKYIGYILASDKYQIPSDEAYEFGDQALSRLSNFYFDFNR